MRYDVERLELHCLAQAVRPGQRPAPRDCGPKHYWMTHPAVRAGGAASAGGAGAVSA